MQYSGPGNNSIEGKLLVVGQSNRLTTAAGQVLHQPGSHAHHKLERRVEQRAAACGMGGVCTVWVHRFVRKWLAIPCRAG